MAALFSCLASAQLYRQLEYVPGLTYTALALLLLLPANVLARGSRLLFARTTGRVLAPLQDVSWSDFLLADMLTSLAKSCMDLERSLCHMATGEETAGRPRATARPAARRCGAAAGARGSGMRAACVHRRGGAPVQLTPLVAPPPLQAPCCWRCRSCRTTRARRATPSRCPPSRRCARPT
jgi:hypothetical protein